jgi:glycerol-3-phosphate dehydrogenase
MLSREHALQTLESDLVDVAVIGGGITGAGVALDAASRGLRVALVERGDFAAGTSSRSSKLVHGGLRYLERLELRLVREALAERRLLSALAPWLVRPLPMVAAYPEGRLDRRLGLGLQIYDALAMTAGRQRPPGGRRSSPIAAGRGTSEVDAARHRVIDAREVAERVPALAGRGPAVGYLYSDCQTDDARLVLTVLGEAERFGAVCANRLEALEISAASGQGLPAVRLRDVESGRELLLRARHVVNATGVWADRTGARAGHADADAVPRIAPSRGTHILVAADSLPLRAGAIVPAGEGRSVFALPWLGRTLIGTTDEHYDGDIEHVAPDAGDVAYLLRATSAFFGAELTAADITGAYAGLRPLIAGTRARPSVDISRRAALYESAQGTITVTGGKLTTYRRMAKLAVDRVVARERRRAPCRTHAIALGAPIEPDALPRVAGVEAAAYPALAARYGRAAAGVLDVARQADELAAPILSGLPDVVAEAAFAARHEQARTVGDVLLRRTRLGVLAGRRLLEPGCAAARRVADALSRELGWDEVRVAAELMRFETEAAAEGIAGP